VLTCLYEQIGVGTQDPLVQVLQDRARTGSQFPRQHGAGVRVHLQRRRLPPRAVERQHQDLAEAFVEAVLRDDTGEFRDDVVVRPVSRPIRNTVSSASSRVLPRSTRWACAQSPGRSVSTFPRHRPSACRSSSPARPGSARRIRRAVGQLLLEHLQVECSGRRPQPIATADGLDRMCRATGLLHRPPQAMNADVQLVHGRRGGRSPHTARTRSSVGTGRD
jgi:hypothetical protein